MSRIDDQSKLSAKEQKALEQHAHEHSGSTLLKDPGAAKFLQKVQLQEQNVPPAKWDEIDAHARRPDDAKYGGVDWIPPDLSLPRLSSAGLWDALERFVQLPDSGLEDFKNRYTSFMPAWFYGVRCGNDAGPKSKTDFLAWQAWRALLREAWHSAFHPEYVAQLLNIPTTPPGNTQFEVQPVCDAQRAVLAMTLESWRARFCPKCGTPFVARKAADKYRPKTCFEEQRRENQRASKRNRARMRAKSSRRTKR